MGGRKSSRVSFCRKCGRLARILETEHRSRRRPQRGKVPGAQGTVVRFRFVGRRRRDTNKLRNCGALSGIEFVSVGRRPKFSRCGRLPRCLAVPGPAPGQLRDVAGSGACILPEPEQRPELATTSPPIPGDSGAFRELSGTFWRPPGRISASPATARVSASGKVNIKGLNGNCRRDQRCLILEMLIATSVLS